MDYTYKLIIFDIYKHKIDLHYSIKHESKRFIVIGLSV